MNDLEKNLQSNERDDNPKAEKKEYDIQMELLDINEFERDTHTLSQGHPPQQIKINNNGLLAIRVFENNYCITSYDNNCKILETINTFNKIEKINNIIKKFLNVGWARDYKMSSNKLLVDEYLINCFPDNSDLEIFKNLIIFLHFEADKDYALGEYMDNLKNMTNNNKNNFISSKSETNKLQIDASLPENPFYKFSSHMYIKDASDLQYNPDVITLQHLKKSLFFHEHELFILNHKADNAESWTLQSITFSHKDHPTAVGMDYKGNFLLVGKGDDLFVYDYHKEPIVKVAELHEDGADFSGMIMADENGTLLVGDNKGNLRKIITNLDSIASYEERQDQIKIARRLKALKRLKRVEKGAPKETGIREQLADEFSELSDGILTQFTGDIDATTKYEQLHDIRQEAETLKKQYEKEIPDKKLLDGIFRPLEEIIAKKEEEIITQEVITEKEEIAKAVEKIETMTADEIIKISINVSKLVTKVNASARVTADIREKTLKICESFSDKASDIIKASEEQMINHLDKLFEEENDKLNRMTKLSELNSWVSLDYPNFREYITYAYKQAPVSHKKFLEHCQNVDKDLRGLKDQFVKKFEEQYQEVRQQVVEKNDTMGDIIESRVDEFLAEFDDLIKKNSFKNDKKALRYVDESKNYQGIIKSIEDLNSDNPDRAAKINKKLKAAIANLVYSAKQMGNESVDAKTGAQMIKFGNTIFPQWEHKTKERTKVKTDLGFKVDERTKGPGVKPEDYFCELTITVEDNSGKSFEIPFNEEELRKYGLDNERNYEHPMSPSYLTIKQAKKIIKAIKEIESPRQNELKNKYEEFRKRIKEFNKEFVKTIKKDWKGEWKGPRHAAETSEDKKWKKLLEDQKNLTKEYIQFIQESGLYAWLKLKNIREKFGKQKEVFKNGQGHVPEMSPYWVRDPQTELYLEEFAQNAKMSLALNDGLISLEGHAGTGKDVLVDMFCAEAKRPKFTFDCSKWTTEFELSQDVALSAEGGASFTVKEDSIVVKAMETPGAVLYFNEFNALPEQAQIFLHSLFDNKRQLTLKTSGGRIVKMDPTVIICSSMNPGYKGTNDPQLATRSRMIPMRISYPEFKKADGRGYAPSEALRVARSVNSLEDLTLDPDIQSNEFVAAWNAYINLQQETKLTPEQKFDMEVIFSIVTFANKIRDLFIKTVEGTALKGDLKINQPFTGREMRRCAYLLGQISPDAKEDISKAEDTAKDMIRRIYSKYIFIKKEADAFETQLKTWTTQKPKDLI